MLEIARLVEREAPDATLVNFTNPAGLITELLRRHTEVRAIGLCNVPWNMRVDLAAALGVPVERVELDYVGLNHLSWVRTLRVDGEDRTSEMLARARVDQGHLNGHEDEPGFSPATLALIGMLPSDYCRYFYETGAMLRFQERHPTRASEVMEIERRLLRRYEDPELREKPPELMERGGAYYSESAAALMADVWSDAGSVQVVNVRNDGALPGLPDDVVIEAPARIGRDGAVALVTAPLRADVDALVRAVKDYELLTIEAAIRGDQQLAQLALITNPLGPDPAAVPHVWERLRGDNQGLLGALDV
jgi:6-phospho-beta-glucosidase